MKLNNLLLLFAILTVFGCIPSDPEGTYLKSGTVEVVSPCHNAGVCAALVATASGKEVWHFRIAPSVGSVAYLKCDELSGDCAQHADLYTYNNKRGLKIK